MIAIVNYGLGNIQAFVNIYKSLNIPVNVAKSEKDLIEVEKILLPGVGSFDWAMTLLNRSGMKERLEEMVINKGCPVLGVCVGMQIMAMRSDEGTLDGLCWIDAEVKKFENESLSYKIPLPHMGWNDVVPLKNKCLFKNLGHDARFYFLHSYYFVPKKEEDVLSVTDYNGNYTSAIRSNNIFGVQFHPEKSHRWGIQLLKNFAEL